MNTDPTVPDTLDDAPEVEADQPQPEAPEETEDADETFPRAYVEKLRKENQRLRQRAQGTDNLAQRLHTALVASDGRLIAPDELPFDAAHLDDPDALTAAIDDLLRVKPYLARRTPHGSIGQGATGGASDVDLAALMRARA